jgi:TolB-like protein/Flp pilus assembly protein TadD
MAYPLPDKPSIAVLPFTNMSEDPEQEYFVDGMTDDLITDLSKISGLFVIARNSVFAYKGKTLKVEQIGRELGVRYLLEGSVRKVGDRVRINAQLIDATTGAHLWAERYDGNLEDVFSLQDKITRKIVSALAVKLTGGEQEVVARTGTDNVAAYDAFLKGWEHYRRFTEEDFQKAASYLEKAIKLDPNYGRACAALALVYWEGALLGWHRSLGEVVHREHEYFMMMKVVRMLGYKYLEMAMKNPSTVAHRLKSQENLYYRLYDEAIAEAERAITLNRNDPEALDSMARVLTYVGRPEEAVDFAERVMRIDPHFLGKYLYTLGEANFAMGKLEEAVTLFERAFSYQPENFYILLFLAPTYALLGRDQEAEATLQNLIDMAPWPWSRYNLRSYMLRRYPFKDLKVSDRLAEGLFKAGVPTEFPKGPGYFRLSEEDRLTGEEIRALLSRHKHAKERYWVEGAFLCERREILPHIGKNCRTVFHNPELKNQHLLVSDLEYDRWTLGPT